MKRFDSMKNHFGIYGTVLQHALTLSPGRDGANVGKKNRMTVKHGGKLLAELRNEDKKIVYSNGILSLI